jgi:hypothetical protein
MADQNNPRADSEYTRTVNSGTVPVPDIPRHIEARSMLLNGRGQIAWSNGRDMLTYSDRDRLACIVGSAPMREIAPVLERLPADVEVVVGEADARAQGRWPQPWRGEPATVFLAPQEAVATRVIRCGIRILTRDDGPHFHHVPADLREELDEALTFSSIATAFDGHIAVSFCYAGSETETLWDVSIDTLAPWRGRGYAGAAAAAMIDAMRARGKRAVWAALDSNTPSLRLAARLGFTPVDRVIVFTKAPAP